MMRNKRQILFACITASLCLHISALGFFQKYSIWFSNLKKPEVRDSWVELVEKNERNQILKETFAPRQQEVLAHAPHHPKIENGSSINLKIHVPDCNFPSNSLHLTPLPIPPQELLISHRPLPVFSIEQKELFNLKEHLPKDLLLEAPDPLKTAANFSPPEPTHTLVKLKTAPALLEKEPPTNPELLSTETLIEAQLTAPQVAKAPKMISFPRLPKIPSLNDLDTASYSDSFDTELVFIPKGDEEGYIFALTLIPRPDLDLPRIRQHLTFLIDRSNSIQQKRLVATKAAVHKAISELMPEDTFNIIAFDSKIEKMSPSPLSCVDASFAVAESFLEKIQLGSFFSSGDLYKALFLTVPGAVKHDELHTAIVLTDTEHLFKKQAQKTLLYDWTAYNGGKVTLYAIGLNQDSHLSTLEATAALNKGKLFHSPSERGLKRKLLKLMKTIQTPIAKNLSCKAISRSPNAKILLSLSGMNHLYLDQPAVILGETDNLDDFILFVQGRLKNRWMNIKKTISFVHAKKGSKSLKEEWALQKSFGLYEQYALDGNPQHIADAAKLLAPYDLPVAIK